MPRLELTRSRDDRRRYDLEGVGAIRLGGPLRGGATLLAEGLEWDVTRRGILRRVTDVHDTSGVLVGGFGPTGWRRGGPLRWEGRLLALRSASAWRERYALLEGGRELAVLDGRGWGRRPVGVDMDDPAAVDPALLLFAAWVVRSLAEDAGSAAGAATVATTSA